ncbi:MAG: DUF5989 family protein [Aureliella sp.]
MSHDEQTVDSDFEAESQKEADGFFAEFATFLVENKKWWMTPIFLVLGLLAVLIVLGASPLAPFIYSIF